MKRLEPITDKRLSDRAYRVLCIVRARQDAGEVVSVRAIRWVLRVGVGTAHRAIRELVDLGYLRLRHAGRGKRAVYQVKR